jgi:hypothetical protein
MTTGELVSALVKTAEHCQLIGYAESLGTAAELSRLAANSTLPLRLLAEWLGRSPEGATALLVALEEYAPSKPVFESIELKASDITIPINYGDLFPTPGKSPEKASGKPAQSSEPGRKGATAEPLVVNLGNVATSLGIPATMQTRRVESGDINDLGDVPGFQGQAAVCGADGKPLVARAKFRDKIRLVEFLDKRGPLLMMRVAEGREKGTIVPGDIKFIDPARRAEVLAALSSFPDANTEFNFSPYESDRDPWTGEEPEVEISLDTVNGQIPPDHG